MTGPLPKIVVDRFFNAVYFRELSTVHRFIKEHGAQIVHAEDPLGRTALHVVARYPADEDVQRSMIKLLLSKGALVNKTDDGGTFPLMSALDKPGIVKLLLDNGADIEQKAKSAYTPLMMAVVMNRPEVVELLLNEGADVSAVNSEGKTALMMAQGRGLQKPLALLQEKERAVAVATHKTHQAALKRVASPKVILRKRAM